MRPSRTAVVTLTAALALAVPGLAPAPAGAASDRARVPRLAFAGEALLPAATTVGGTTVGGLSSITYDAARDRYYAISDARPDLDQGPYRFYTLRLDVADGALTASDVVVESVTTFADAAGHPFPLLSLDPEGLALTRSGTLVMTSEGFSRPTLAVPPRVLEFGLDGRLLREIDLPDRVDPVFGQRGVRENLGIESAALTRSGRHLFTGFENALVQDGPAATAAGGSPVRLQRWNARTGRLVREVVYRTDPVVDPPAPGAFAVNGLVELLPMSSQFVLAMERSFTVGAGNTIRLYRSALPGATDVRARDALTGTERPARKRLVLDLDSLGLTLDNLEGMTLGPRLAGGGRALVMVSDNNFAGGPSQFLLFRATEIGPR